MNVETVLSSTSESGNSNTKRYPSRPPSFRKPAAASRRLSQDPPGVTVTVTPAEAILEVVPQDVAMDDPPDHQSTQSTLTGPPTINFQNQPTDEDWELQHKEDPYNPNIRRSQHSRKSNRPSNRQSRGADPRPSPKSRDYASDESSSLPEIPAKGNDEEHDTDEEDILKFLNRAYTPDASLLFSDRVDDEEDVDDEDEDDYLQQSALLNLDTPKGNRQMKTSLDEGVHHHHKVQPPPMQRIPSKKSMASTIDTSQKKQAGTSKRQRPTQIAKVMEEDDVDSDLTPVMKSPQGVSKASLQAKKQKEKQTSNPSSSMRSPPFQKSPGGFKKKAASTSKQQKEPKPAAPLKSKRSTSKANAEASKSKRSIRPGGKTKEVTSKKANATPSKSKRSIRSSQPQDAKDDAKKKQSYSKSPTSVLDDPNDKQPSSHNKKTKAAASPKKKKTSNTYLSDDDSSSFSYQYYGKPRDPKNDRNALLGLDDASSTSSSLYYENNKGKPRPPAGRDHKNDRNALLGLDDASSSTSSSLFGNKKRRPTRIFGSEPKSPSRNQKSDRDALLGLDDGSSASSSLFGTNNKGGDDDEKPPRPAQRRPTRVFGVEPKSPVAARNKKKDRNALLGLDDDDDASSTPSSLYHGKNRGHPNHSRLLGYDEEDGSSLDEMGRNNNNNDRRGHARGAGNHPQHHPQQQQRQPVQSFAQIPIHPDMTPEEWQIAQEQIEMLESELDKVSALCHELTEAAEAENNKAEEEEAEGAAAERGGGENAPPDGNWTRAQEQVKYLEQELEVVQELCTMLTETAKESTDALELMEGEKQRLEDMIARLEAALAKSKNRMQKQEKALDDLVQENDSKCCSWCWDWISEPVVWFVSYLYRID